MSEIKERASRVRHLKNDDAFNELFEEVRTNQASIFLNPYSTDEDRKKAHDIVIALSTIENYIDSILQDEKIFDKRNPT